MPFTVNAVDTCKVYFEEDRGTGPPVVVLPGLGASLAAARASGIATSLARGFRRIFVDHHASGRSDKAHEAQAHRTPLRVADVTGVLDVLAVEDANIVGTSRGARLGYGIGEHAPERVRSLTLLGQQPYAMHPDGQLVSAVTQALEDGKGMRPFVDALERFWPLPDAQRTELPDNDVTAIHAAWSAALAEGAVATHLTTWQLPCLISAGTGDDDFFDQARRAAQEIPNARFVPLNGLNHPGEHFNADQIVPHVKRFLEDVSQ